MIFGVEDSLTQRVIMLFDHSVSGLNHDSEDEILIYNLITCLYLCLKVESRTSWPFDVVLDQVT